MSKPKLESKNKEGSPKQLSVPDACDTYQRSCY